MHSNSIRTHMAEDGIPEEARAVGSWSARDEHYREIVLAPLRDAMKYKPKMGTDKAVSLPDFISLYSSDPLYHWMGLDNELSTSPRKQAAVRPLSIGTLVTAWSVWYGKSL